MMSRGLGIRVPFAIETSKAIHLSHGVHRGNARPVSCLVFLVSSLVIDMLLFDARPSRQTITLLQRAVRYLTRSLFPQLPHLCLAVEAIQPSNPP